MCYLCPRSVPGHFVDAEHLEEGLSPRCNSSRGLGALAAPLAQASGLERPGLDAIVGRMLGFGLVSQRWEHPPCPRKDEALSKLAEVEAQLAGSPISTGLLDGGSRSFPGWPGNQFCSSGNYSRDRAQNGEPQRLEVQ